MVAPRLADKGGDHEYRAYKALRGRFCLNPSDRQPNAVNGISTRGAALADTRAAPFGVMGISLFGMRAEYSVADRRSITFRILLPHGSAGGHLLGRSSE